MPSKVKRDAYRTAAEWLEGDLDTCDYPPPYDDVADMAEDLHKALTEIVEELRRKAEGR